MRGKYFSKKKIFPGEAKKFYISVAFKISGFFHINFRSNFYIFGSEVLHIPLSSDYAYLRQMGKFRLQASFWNF